MRSGCLIATLAVVGVVAWFAAPFGSRSVAATFNDGAVTIRYTVYWGWEMEETATFLNKQRSIEDVTIRHKIFEKPYRSGAVIYSETDGDHIEVHFGKHLGGGLVRYSIATGELQLLDICAAITASPKNKDDARARWHPGAGVHPSYYLPGTTVLGQFGIISHGLGRGEDVAFEGADRLTEEPKLDEHECP